MDQSAELDRRRGTSPAAGPSASAAGPRMSSQESDAPAAGYDASGTPERSWRRIFDNHLLPILLITPALVVIGGLVGYPVFRTAWLSLNDASGLQALTTGAMSFIGLDNYVEIAQDPDLRRSALTTVLFGLSCVVATMAVGMAVALLLNRRFKGRVLLGILVLLPWAIPHVAASYVWQWLFQDQYGVINWSLVTLGLDGFEGFAWFNDWYTAFIVIGIVVVWQSFPFVAIALLAGLQTVPSDVLEAATIDGASAWQRTRLVTLPMLKPLLLVLLVISTIWDFKVFDQVFVLTEGGPARKTEILTISTYQQAFGQSEYGLGSALAMVLFLILLVVTVIYVKLVKDEERIA